jgi:hypothetical protein
MGEAAEELRHHLRQWAAQHDLSNVQVVVILARMMSNYEDFAFEALDKSENS